MKKFDSQSNFLYKEETGNFPTLHSKFGINYRNSCKVCNQMIDCVYIECGHMIACVKCSETLEFCPICEKPIKNCIITD